MPTISSMLRGTYLMYKYNQKNSGNIFSSSSNALWTDYSSKTSSTSSTLSGLMGIRSNLSDMVKTYNTTKQTFNTELDDTLDDLKKSVANIKSLDFDVDNNEKNITEAIKNFADNYNDTIKFFSDNASVSRRVKNLSSTFADTIYNSKSAASIGIKISSDGKMTVDEDALAQKIVEEPTRVKAVMSTLTNKSERHMSFVNVQKNNLFPAMNTMLGSSFRSASMYSGNSLLRISNYSSVGNLLNYFV